MNRSADTYMVQYKDNLNRRKLLTTETQEIQEPELDDNNFLICDDCKHNCITYEPSKDRTCLCECHYQPMFLMFYR